MASTVECGGGACDENAGVPSSGGNGGTGGGAEFDWPIGGRPVGGCCCCCCCRCCFAMTGGSLAKTSRRIERNSRRVDLDESKCQRKPVLVGHHFPKMLCCLQGKARPPSMPLLCLHPASLTTPDCERASLTFQPPLPLDQSAK